MSTKPLTQRRSHQLAELYTEHHATLQRHIAHRVNAPRALIEDACQAAWTRLASRHDIALDSDHTRGWLYTVAVREAWALTGERQLTDPLPHWLGQADDDVGAEALARITDLEHLALLNTLKPAEREALILHAAGHSYRQIAQATGASYTAVNRRIREGRARLRANTRP
ncbi:MAG: RNA polymerase sigma factor [Solirubrobacteraceae bacterium]